MKKTVLTKKRPEKGLTKALRKSGGRNSHGRITVRHRGGGHKRRYRIIEFAQKKLDVGAKVIAIEYDPNRTCNIALLEYDDKEKKYIIAPEGIDVGEEIVFSEKADLNIGNRMRLKNIPVGTIVHNIELMPGHGGKIARSAGSGAQVMAHEGKYTNIKMPSTEVRKVPTECFASIGQLGNSEHRFHKIGKAGGNRRRGIRPTVRGSAMNPVDHPHGGGEGKAPIGLKHPKTPWGKPALGVKTRRKKWSNKLIIQRRKKKRKG